MDAKKIKSKLDMTILTILGVLIIGAALLYSMHAFFSSKANEGEKTITIEVIDINGKSTLYELETEEKYLRQAMEEAAAQGFTFSGAEKSGSLSTMVDTVNGIRADFSLDGAYWALMVNGEYGMRSIDSQVLADGDAYQFVYTVVD